MQVQLFVCFSIHAKFVDNALYKARRALGEWPPATPEVKAKSTHINLVRGFREKIQIMPNTTAVPQLFRTAQAEDSQWVPSS